VLNKPAPSLSCAALQCCAEGVLSAASFSGRCREAGGEKGEALLEGVVSRPWPLGADPTGECSLGGMVQVAQLSHLAFQVCCLRSGNAASHLAGGHLLEVLFDVHLAGRARRCRGGSHRRFGRDKGVWPHCSPLADPVLRPPLLPREKHCPSR
jgi:hypothetical protein